MSLVTALYHTINEEWLQQDHNEEVFNVLTTVYVHPSLAAAIKAGGEELPGVFDPNVFNEEENYCELNIEVRNQDELVNFGYE